MTGKLITTADVKGARLVLKTSVNPKEISAAQKVLKLYNEQELEKELAKKNPDVKRCTFLKATVGRYNNLLERR